MEKKLRKEPDVKKNEDLYQTQSTASILSEQIR